MVDGGAKGVASDVERLCAETRVCVAEDVVDAESKGVPSSDVERKKMRSESSGDGDRRWRIK